MEPSILLLILVTCLPVGLFAWSFGAWENARANAVLAVIGLVIVVVGVALAGVVLALALTARTTGANGGVLLGAFVLVGLLLTLGVEWFGMCLTLAVCLICLRRTARRDSAWFTALLIGALAPVLGGLALLLFWPALGALTRFNRTLEGILFNAHVLIPILAPVVAGAVTTAYALWTARPAATFGVPA